MWDRMNESQSKKLKDMSNNYNIPLSRLIETYSTKQTEYIRRDYNNGLPLSDYMQKITFGNKALNIMDLYAKHYGAERFKNYVNNKTDNSSLYK